MMARTAEENRLRCREYYYKNLNKQRERSRKYANLHK